MIIFYNKKTGKINGTISGRIHKKAHLKMWVGDKKDNDRIIVNWKQTGKEFKRKVLIDNKVKILKGREYEPNHKQKDLFINFDNGKEKVGDYKVKIKNKKVVGFIKKKV